MSNLPPVEETIPKPLPPRPVCPAGMAKFTMYRQGDESGVSGTGIVAQGVLFANGVCVLQWLVEPDPGDTQVKQDFGKFLDTHVRSHPTNKTIITWEDGTRDFYPEEED